MTRPADASTDRLYARRSAASFEQDFDRFILPHLDALEAKRRACLRTLAWMWLGALAFGVLQMAVYWAVLPYPLLYATAIFTAGFLGWALTSQPIAAYGAAVRELVMPAVCDFVGHVTYKRHCGVAIDPAPLRDAGLVGNYNQVAEEDLVAGTYRGRRFRMVETKLAVVEGKPMRTVTPVFQGVIVAIEPPPGSGWGLPTPPIDPALLATLASAAGLHGDKQARATVLDGALVLLLPVGARFEPGSLIQPASRMERDMRRTLHDVTLPHRLIEALDGGRTGPP